MKKYLSLFLALVMILSVTTALTSCGSSNVDYKIGIITGTVSQGEEEYQAAVNLKE